MAIGTARVFVPPNVGRNGRNGFGMTDEESDALKDGWSLWVDTLEDALGTRVSQPTS